MIKKIKKFLIDNSFYIIVLAIFFALIFIELDYSIYSPGGLEDLTDRIEVENAYDSKGSFNLTYVTSRKGSLLNILASFIVPSWDLESNNNSKIDNEDIDSILEREKISLKQTSYDAIIAAFNSANIDVKVKNKEVVVYYVYDFSITTLKIGDIIKKVNGIEVSSNEELINIIKSLKERDEVTFDIIRNEKETTATATLINKDNNLVVGIILTELKNIVTTPYVKYVFKENESGSSRGLMCALDIYNKITEYDLTQGLIISGTGTIDEYGNVTEIGGVKYKIKGAVKNKANIFLVPYENYDEAIKEKEENGYNIDIIKVKTLDEAIEKLKNYNN